MGTELLSYRLRSARRKKRISKTGRDKQLLRLEKERNLLRKNPDRVITVTLDEPYQKGWKRLFVLKPDVAKSNKAEFYQQILNSINRVQYHYDRSFKKTKRRYREKYNLDMPVLQTEDRFQWRMNREKLSDEQRACFNKVEFWDDNYYRWIYKYEFMYPELFKIVVQPHIVTTVKLHDIDMEKRISYIDDHLQKSGLDHRVTKLKGGYYKNWKSWYYIEKAKYISPLKSKRVRIILEEQFG